MTDFFQIHTPFSPFKDSNQRRTYHKEEVRITTNFLSRARFIMCVHEVPELEHGGR